MTRPWPRLKTNGKSKSNDPYTTLLGVIDDGASARLLITSGPKISSWG
jgi:hypothetical protein